MDEASLKEKKMETLWDINACLLGCVAIAVEGHVSNTLVYLSHSVMLSRRRNKFYKTNTN